MRKRTLKGAAMVALAGTVLGFGGCLNLTRIFAGVVDHYSYDLLLATVLPEPGGLFDTGE